MSDPFLGEIKVVSFSFAPRGWALCNGQLLPINQNQALFSLLGTYYGGDGRTTFALPNLIARTPLHIGNAHSIGEAGGESSHTLSPIEMPRHTHALRVTAHAATAAAPQDRVFAKAAPGLGNTYRGPTEPTEMAPRAVGPAGTGNPHENMQPYLTLNFIIALQGIFPVRV